MQVRLRFATFAGLAAWWTGIAIHVHRVSVAPVAIAAAVAVHVAIVAGLAGLETVCARDLRAARWQ